LNPVISETDCDQVMGYHLSRVQVILLEVDISEKYGMSQLPLWGLRGLNVLKILNINFYFSVFRPLFVFILYSRRQIYRSRQCDQILLNS
jgi:hypothetical protein